jgi:hypothetical protein
MSRAENAKLFEDGNEVTPEKLKHVFHAVVRSCANRVSSYCWHPNGESNDADGLHQLLGISCEDLAKILRSCGYIKAGSRTMTKKSVDALATGIDSEKNIAESNGYKKYVQSSPIKRKQCYYLRLGKKSEIEGCCTDASQQYKGTKLEHLPQSGIHLVERINKAEREALAFFLQENQEEVNKREATPGKKHYGAKNGIDQLDEVCDELVGIFNPNGKTNLREIRQVKRIISTYLKKALLLYIP